MVFDKTFGQRLLIWLFYAITSGIILLVLITHPEIEEGKHSAFPDMVYGRANKPYVYRALLPITVRIIAGITPERMKEKIIQFISSRTFIRKIIEDKVEDKYMYEYLIALVLIFGCFLGLAFLLRYSLRLFYNLPPFVADFAPVGGLLSLPLFFRHYFYLYDPSTLFLFTLAITLIATRKYLLFYIVFLFSAVNKETSILLLGVFLIENLRSPKLDWRLIGHLSLQLVLWTVARVFITNIFKVNPGSFVEFHLLDYNLQLIFRPFRLIYFLIIFALFFSLVRYHWNEKPFFLRTGLLITWVPLITFALFFGFLDEMRAYCETFPFVFLLSVPTVVELFNINKSQ